MNQALAIWGWFFRNRLWLPGLLLKIEVWPPSSLTQRGPASWGADYLLGVSQVVRSRWWVRTPFLYSLAFVHLCVLSLNLKPNGLIGPVMPYGHEFAWGISHLSPAEISEDLVGLGKTENIPLQPITRLQCGAVPSQRGKCHRVGKIVTDSAPFHLCSPPPFSPQGPAACLIF